MHNKKFFFVCLLTVFLSVFATPAFAQDAPPAQEENVYTLYLPTTPHAGGDDDNSVIASGMLGVQEVQFDREVNLDGLRASDFALREGKQSLKVVCTPTESDEWGDFSWLQPTDLEILRTSGAEKIKIENCKLNFTEAQLTEAFIGNGSMPLECVKVSNLLYKVRNQMTEKLIREIHLEDSSPIKELWVPFMVQ